MIAQKTIQEVIDRARVEEVIEQFVHLKRRGVNLLGLCPFHDEKTPSFVVSPAKNIYKCFGCGKAGDAITFIKDHEGMSYVEALRYLADKYNIEIEEKEFSPEEKYAIELRDSYFIINEFAQKYFEKQLFETDKGKSIGLGYFKKRGFRESVIKKFQLGYASQSWDDLTQSAIKHQYNIEHFRTLGLTTKTDKDFFRDRVMFSIHNLSGKIIAFAGRTLSSDKNTPKYINSPESEIYNKRKVLYGLYFAKQAIRKADECILVEGYTDVISLHQAGMENVVATSGTALTSDQVRLMKRYSNNVKVIFDGDAAGIKAALRGLDIILEEDLNVRLVLLPDGEDPDSFVQKAGIEKFTAYLNNEARDFILFKLGLLLKEAGNDPIRKTMVLKDIVSSLALIPDLIKRNVYTQQCSRLLEMDERIIITEVNKIIQASIKKKQSAVDRNDYTQRDEHGITLGTEATQKLDSLSKYAYKERDIIRILLNLGDNMYDNERKISVAQYLIFNLNSVSDDFEHPIYSQIIEETKGMLKTNPIFDPHYFLHHSDDEIRNLAIDLTTSPYQYAEWEKRGIFLQTQKSPDQNFIKDSYQAILRFKLEKIKVLLNEVKSKLHEMENKHELDEDYQLAIRAMQQLLQERNHIAKELNSVIIP